jgi:hypothetical protein
METSPIRPGNDSKKQPHAAVALPLPAIFAAFGMNSALDANESKFRNILQRLFFRCQCFFEL